MCEKQGELLYPQRALDRLREAEGTLKTEHRDKGYEMTWHDNKTDIYRTH